MPDNKKILIIEDEIDLCLLLRDYFVRKQYDVTVAHTLNEGKALIDSGRRNILFLDNNLPDGAAWNSAPVFAASYPEMYIVFISGFQPVLPQMPPDARYGKIEKPISFAELDKQFSIF